MRPKVKPALMSSGSCEPTLPGCYQHKESWSCRFVLTGQRCIAAHVFKSDRRQQRTQLVGRVAARRHGVVVHGRALRIDHIPAVGRRARRFIPKALVEQEMRCRAEKTARNDTPVRSVLRRTLNRSGVLRFKQQYASRHQRRVCSLQDISGTLALEDVELLPKDQENEVKVLSEVGLA